MKNNVENVLAAIKRHAEEIPNAPDQSLSTTSLAWCIRYLFHYMELKHDDDEQKESGADQERRVDRMKVTAAVDKLIELGHLSLDAD